jgi:hypothetical protein
MELAMTTRLTCCLLAATLGAMSFTCTLHAADPKPKGNPHVWKPKTTSVSVFKNGMGFFMRSGQVRLRDDWCVSSVIPPAAFGTLAIYSHEQDRTVDVVGSGAGEVVDFDGVDAPDTLEARRARLSAAVDLKLTLTYERENRTLSATGKLESVGEEFAVLLGPDQHFAVPIAAISRMAVLELPVRVHLTPGGDPAAPVTLGMAYLRKGITWIPEYTLEVVDDETARLSLRGTLVNEAEDLIHCDVNFVVGVPHFVHTDFMAPIAVGQVIRTIGTAVAPRQVATQIMNRAAIVSNSTTAPQFRPGVQPVVQQGRDLAQATGNLPSLAGPGGADYTVYTKKDMTVRRGEKAIVSLFTKTIKWSHLYRWNTTGRMEHRYVLHNGTDTAWTTGPCLIMAADRPLSEDLLKYTPTGGRAEIPVTTAINIAHEAEEAETDRRLKAHNPRHNVFYDLVTLTGTIQLKNFEQRPVTVVVTVPAPGKPTAASDEGAIKIDATKLKLIERRGTVTWTVTVEPGKTRDLSYTYERYVPSS